MASDSVFVVITTHNRRDFVAITLSSVLRQRDVEFDELAVDDRSRTVRPCVPRSRGGSSCARHPLTTFLWASASAQQGHRSLHREVARLHRRRPVGTREAGSATTTARDTGRLWVHTGIVEIDKRGGAIAGSRPSPPERVGAKLLHVNLIPGGSSRVLVSRQAVTDVGGWDLRALQWPMGPVDPIGSDGPPA
jgi:hypothetical protein